jgi:dTMP kinase
VNGKLIVIEGIDGAGGETQSKKLAEYLREKGTPCERVFYPDYGNPVGDFISGYLHNKHELSNDAQFLLYSLDMLKDREKILGWLREGKVVVADRYLTTTMAYQGLQGFPVENALKFAEILRFPKPDIIIYLKISSETSVGRKTKEKGRLDRYEADKDFLRKVSGSYDSLIEKQVWGSWFVVDGEKPKEEVFAQIKKVLRA